MFEQTFTTDIKTKRQRTIAFALALQTLGVIALVLLPLTSVGSIEMGNRFVLLPPPRLKAQEPPVKTTSQRTVSGAALRVAQLNNLPRPRAFAVRIQPLIPGDAPVLSGSTLAGAAAAGGIPNGIGSSNFGAVPLQPAPQPKLPQRPVRVSSTMSQSQLISGPKPIYPRLALSARIAGTVRLQATISRDGRIENLHVLSGHPMLTGPALEAVRTWRYRPLLLNGDPVEVITEIDVNFVLQP